MNGREYSRLLIDGLEKLAGTVDESSIVKDSMGIYNEKDYLLHIVKDARHLIRYGEWYIAVENTIDNLCEVDYKLDNDLVLLVEKALKCGDDRENHLSLLDLLRR